MADVHVISSDQLDDNTPQTPGLTRLVAFDSRTQTQQLSAFRADVAPGAATGAHHHGEQETVLYVISGVARYRWGERLEHVVEAGPGDFVFIPAHTIHQEINASATEPTVWAVVRSGPDPIVVNLPDLDHLTERPSVHYG
ncbi:MAG: cupin domain-containing protein [Aldersonia sp.]|nr:cupin domain-containing protein [Aldersonia sp.]